MNVVYPKFLEDLWNGLINIGSDTFRVALVSSSYTYNSAHHYFSDLAGVLVVGTLTGVVAPSGIFDADDKIVTVSGTPKAAVIYKWTGTGSTSPLFRYMDDGAGFNVAYAGDVNIKWPDAVTTMIFPTGGV